MTRAPVMRLALEDDEIIVDSFAGGGGASEGIRLALGRDPDIAINHDAEAIALHAANHPGTKHFIENVWKVDPLKATNGRRVGLMWLSPDCKHFSKAKGGKPVSKKIRGLAWIAVRWAAAVKPRIMVLENVEEFQGWGPVLADGKPCPVRKGKTFRAFVSRLRKHGYNVEWRELRACDFGAPTIRKRLFLIARCDGRPIVWPKPTHGKHASQPWRTAAECIDWSLACPSIFTRKKELAENTLKLIARGLKRFVIDSPKPFIVNMAHGGKLEDVDQPISTIATEKGGCRAVVVPFTAGVGGRAGQSAERGVDRPAATTTAKADAAVVVPMIVPMTHENRATGVDEPLQTVTTQGNRFNVVAPMLTSLTHHGGDRNESLEEPMMTVTGAHRGEKALVAPILVRPAHGEVDKTGKKRGKGCETVEEPLGTVLASGEHAVVAAHITKFRGGATGSAGDEPMPTVTANSFVKRPGGAAPLGIVGAFLKPRYGEAEGQEMRARSLEEPAPTVVPTGNGGDLVAASLIEYHSETTEDGARASSLTVPLPVQDTSNRFGLTAAFLAKHYGDTGQRPGSDLAEPVGTITASDHNALVAAHVEVMHSTSTGQAADEPLQAICGGANHFAEVRAFMVAYYGNERDGGDLFDPMRTVTPKDRLGLVTVEGVEYAIADIGMRMLTPRELYNAQGFRRDYAIDIQFNGKPLTKTAQVRMVGNSVCPPMARALVLANVGGHRSSAIIPENDDFRAEDIAADGYFVDEFGEEYDFGPPDGEAVA